MVILTYPLLVAWLCCFYVWQVVISLKLSFCTITCQISKALLLHHHVVLGVKRDTFYLTAYSFCPLDSFIHLIVAVERKTARWQPSFWLNHFLRNGFSKNFRVTISRQDFSIQSITGDIFFLRLYNFEILEDKIFL